jgi:hypothetical protein
MSTFKFWAIENYEGSQARTLFELEAITFAEACYIAQENEINDAFEQEREPEIYDEFKLVK